MTPISLWDTFILSLDYFSSLSVGLPLVIPTATSQSISLPSYHLKHLLYWKAFTGSPLLRKQSSHLLHGVQSLSEFCFYYNFLLLSPTPFHRLPAFHSYRSTSKFPNSHVLTFSLPFTHWLLYWVYSIPSCSSFKPQLSPSLLSLP